MKNSDDADEFSYSHKRRLEEIKDHVELLVFVEVVLMFTSLLLIVNVLGFSILFHIVSTLFAGFVLKSAYHAAKIISPSIPLQRPLGVLFYLIAHATQAISHGQAPIFLTAVLITAAPLSIYFLFEP